MLMTALPSTNAHSCMITDLAMITNQQGSVYRPVWQWMMTGPAPLPVVTMTGVDEVRFNADASAAYQVEQRGLDIQQYTPVGPLITNVQGDVAVDVTGSLPGWIRVRVSY